MLTDFLLVSNRTFFVAAVASSAIFFYDSYWAFEIGKSLTRVYRGQAFRLGLLSFVFALNFLLRGVGYGAFSSNIVIILLLQVLAFSSAILVLLWIDSTVLVARRSDPLRRDVANWAILRYFVWILVLSQIALSSGLILRYLTLHELLVPAPIFNFLEYAPLVTEAILGAIVLTVSASRTADHFLRAHIFWFGMFIACVFIGFFDIVILISMTGVPHSSIIGLASFFIGSYCLYKSARKLAPLNHMPSVASSDS